MPSSWPARLFQRQVRDQMESCRWYPIQVMGDSAEFAKQVRTQLEKFQSRWPVLRFLAVPVTMTFLVIPPEQGQDQANIARRIGASVPEPSHECH
jgi:hypothetical protein